jgi:hypothetical protein
MAHLQIVAFTIVATPTPRDMLAESPRIKSAGRPTSPRPARLLHGHPAAGIPPGSTTGTAPAIEARDGVPPELNRRTAVTAWWIRPGRSRG